MIDSKDTPKIILTTDNIPTHALNNDIIMKNVVEYLLG